MRSTSGRYWTPAVAGVLLLWSCQPTFAAPQQNRSADRERFGKLVAMRSRSAKAAPTIARPASSRITDPYSKAGVDAFNRRVVRQGRTPPPVTATLDPGTAAFRRNYILSLYQFRGVRRGGYAGGVYFTPPAGTPYFPVSPVNIFNYFPVYRVP